MAVYNLTSKCNLNCLFCSNNDNFRRKIIEPKLDEIEDYFVKNVPLNESNITLTGGEPTLRNDLFEILKFFNKRYPKATIFLLSNGRMLYYKNYVKRFLSFKNICFEIPINSYESKLHEYLTKNPGSFNQTVLGIKNLLSNKQAVVIRVLINKLNYRLLTKISKFIISEFPTIERIFLINMKIAGQAYKNRKELAVKFSDSIIYVEKTLDFFEKNNIKVNILHQPFCLINEKYWKHIIFPNPYKISFNKCKLCKKNDICPGVSVNYPKVFGGKEFKPFN